MANTDPKSLKADMLDRVRASRARLDHAVAALTPEQMEAEGLVGGWSAKATLAHITWWEDVAIHALRGEPDEDILAGEEWDTDRANAVLFARNQSRPLDDVLSAFHATYTKLLHELEALPSARLDEPGPYEGSLLDVIASNTYEHYDGHLALLASAFGLTLP